MHEHLLALTARARHDQVYTLHAELEGMKLRPVFERLLAGWRAQGHSLVSLNSLHEDRRAAELPKHRVELAAIPGRSGALAVQGKRVDSGA